MDQAPKWRARGKTIHGSKKTVSDGGPGQAPHHTRPALGMRPPETGPAARDSADPGPTHGASPPSNTSGKLCRATPRSSTSNAS
jgi:hypothetical protein